MKLLHTHISNFKGIRELDIPFGVGMSSEPRNLTCLIGDNGSGKTTALQAIALTLSMATRRTRHPAEFRWHGFLAERTGSFGPTRVELDVIWDSEEIELTHRMFVEWYDSQPSDWRQSHRIVEPSHERVVKIVYEEGRLYSPMGLAAVNQFLGRHYIKWLARTTPARKDLFSRLGDIFWFDQYRNLGTVFADREIEPGDRFQQVESWSVGVEQLREYLLGWWAYSTSQLKGQGKHYIKDLESRFAEVFPGTEFKGTMPRAGVTDPGVKDFYFLIERHNRLYDIAEMSSGEQSIFSLLYEFIRLNISQSVVLIDELELHLHAPAQQGMYAKLPKLGRNCQFIITTHSEFLTGVIPEDQEVRLEGGRRCL